MLYSILYPDPYRCLPLRDVGLLGESCACLIPSYPRAEETVKLPRRPWLGDISLMSGRSMKNYIEETVKLSRRPWLGDISLMSGRSVVKSIMLW